MRDPGTSAHPEPVAIASLLPSATEMVCRLGAGQQLVGVSHECDYPADVLHLPRLTRCRIDSRADSGEIDWQTRELLAAGQPLYLLEEELLRRLRPSLLLTQAQCDVCAVRYEDVRDFVNGDQALAGTKLIALNPQSLADVLDDIQRIGAAIGREPEATRLIDELQERIDRVRTNTGELPAHRRRRVACIEWLEPLMLAANWTPELVELAGGDCPLTKAGQHSVPLTWDELRAFDPEVVVVMPCGFDLARTRREASVLCRLPGWDQLAAVQRGAVFCVDGNALFNRSGPRLVDSLELLARLVHPELAAAQASVPAPRLTP